MPDDNNSGDSAGAPPEEASNVEQARERLSAFLEFHPYSTIDEIDSEEGKRLVIKNPWGEDALVIYLPDDIDRFAHALNNLHLPERFTAIWHRDTKDLEVIWTAYPLPKQYDEVKNRRFSFNYDSKTYECEFGRSSERLLLIAEHAELVGMSPTGHRNLFSFNNYAKRDKTDNGDDTLTPIQGEPISFWIKPVEWDEDLVLRLFRHLNFYMTYYDNKSPEIAIHSPKTEATKPRTRYLFGDFPQRLDAREIEGVLLQLWAAAQSGDAGRRFVYFYRIIEYASHTYTNEH